MDCLDYSTVITQSQPLVRPYWKPESFLNKHLCLLINIYRIYANLSLLFELHSFTFFANSQVAKSQANQLGLAQNRYFSPS